MSTRPLLERIKKQQLTIENLRMQIKRSESSHQSNRNPRSNRNENSNIKKQRKSSIKIKEKDETISILTDRLNKAQVAENEVNYLKYADKIQITQIVSNVQRGSESKKSNTLFGNTTKKTTQTSLLIFMNNNSLIQVQVSDSPVKQNRKLILKKIQPFIKAYQLKPEQFEVKGKTVLLKAKLHNMTGVSVVSSNKSQISSYIVKTSQSRPSSAKVSQPPPPQVTNRIDLIITNAHRQRYQELLAREANQGGRKGLHLQKNRYKIENSEQSQIKKKEPLMGNFQDKSLSLSGTKSNKPNSALKHNSRLKKVILIQTWWRQFLKNSYLHIQKYEITHFSRQSASLYDKNYILISSYSHRLLRIRILFLERKSKSKQDYLFYFDLENIMEVLQLQPSKDQYEFNLFVNQVILQLLTLYQIKDNCLDINSKTKLLIEMNLFQKSIELTLIEHSFFIFNLIINEVNSQQQIIFENNEEDYEDSFEQDEDQQVKQQSNNKQDINKEDKYMQQDDTSRNDQFNDQDNYQQINQPKSSKEEEENTQQIKIVQLPQIFNQNQDYQEIENETIFDKEKQEIETQIQQEKQIQQQQQDLIQLPSNFNQNRDYMEIDEETIFEKEKKQELLNQEEEVQQENQIQQQEIIVQNQNENQAEDEVNVQKNYHEKEFVKQNSQEKQNIDLKNEVDEIQMSQNAHLNEQNQQQIDHQEKQVQVFVESSQNKDQIYQDEFEQSQSYRQEEQQEIHKSELKENDLQIHEYEEQNDFQKAASERPKDVENKNIENQSQTSVKNENNNQRYSYDDIENDNGDDNIEAYQQQQLESQELQQQNLAEQEQVNQQKNEQFIEYENSYIVEENEQIIQVEVDPVSNTNQQNFEDPIKNQLERFPENSTQNFQEMTELQQIQSKEQSMNLMQETVDQQQLNQNTTKILVEESVNNNNFSNNTEHTKAQDNQAQQSSNHEGINEQINEMITSYLQQILAEQLEILNPNQYQIIQDPINLFEPNNNDESNSEQFQFLQSKIISQPNNLPHFEESQNMQNQHLMQSKDILLLNSVESQQFDPLGSNNNFQQFLSNDFTKSKFVKEIKEIEQEQDNNSLYCSEQTPYPQPVNLKISSKGIELQNSERLNTQEEQESDMYQTFKFQLTQVIEPNIILKDSQRDSIKDSQKDSLIYSDASNNSNINIQQNQINDSKKQDAIKVGTVYCNEIEINIMKYPDENIILIDKKNICKSFKMQRIEINPQNIQDNFLKNFAIYIIENQILCVEINNILKIQNFVKKLKYQCACRLLLQNQYIFVRLFTSVLTVQLLCEPNDKIAENIQLRGLSRGDRKKLKDNFRYFAPLFLSFDTEQLISLIKQQNVNN